MGGAMKGLKTLMYIQAYYIKDLATKSQEVNIISMLKNITLLVFKNKKTIVTNSNQLISCLSLVQLSKKIKPIINSKMIQK